MQVTEDGDVPAPLKRDTATLASELVDVALGLISGAVAEAVRQQLSVAADSRSSPPVDGVMTKPLLTPDQVARRCGVTPKTVRDWISRGTLRAVELPGGRALRISEEALAAALATKRPDETDINNRAAKIVAGMRK